MGIRLTQLSTGLKVEAELGNKIPIVCSVSYHIKLRPSDSLYNIILVWDCGAVSHLFSCLAAASVLTGLDVRFQRSQILDNQCLEI